MNRGLGLVALGVLVAYLVMLGWLYFNQRQLQYFPTHRDAGGKGLGKFRPWLSRAGVFLGYRRAAERAREIVLFFHGNAGEAIDRDWFADVVPPDRELILVEYPGFGARPGAPSQEALFRAAEEAYDEAAALAAVPVVVVGESLGSGVATYLATRRPVARLALISPFTSAAEVARLRYPFVPIRLLMKDPYPSDEYAKNIAAPAHLIHGTADEVIPVELGRRLRQAFPDGRAYLTEIEGYGHGDIDHAIRLAPEAESFRAFLRGASRE